MTTSQSKGDKFNRHKPQEYTRWGSIKKYIPLFLCFWTVITHAQNNILEVTIRRSPCSIGRSPDYTLTIYNDGTVNYFGRSNARFSGKFSGTLPKQKVEKVFNAFSEEEFLDLPVYTFDPTSSATLQIRLLLRNKNKFGSVFVDIKNAQNGPVYLSRLAYEMDSLVAIEKIKWDTLKIQNNDRDAILDSTITQEKEIPIVDQTKPLRTNDQISDFVDQMPEFPGGEEAMYKYLISNVQIPQQFIEKGSPGRVVVAFVVERDGSLSNVKVRRGIGYGCDEESIRVIETMPKWVPGKQNGIPVRVSYSLPIMFEVGRFELKDQ